MTASVVFRDHLDVLVAVAVVDLVLDPEVWEVYGAIEVGQVVLTCPRLDLALATIGPAIAVRPAPVVRLQPLLVLALEVDFEDDARDLGALLTEPRLSFAVRPVQGRVMGELAPSADARVERLATAGITVAPVCFQKAASSVCQRQDAVPTIEWRCLQQPLTYEVPLVVPSVEAEVSGVVEVALGDHTKRPDRSEGPSVFAVELERAIARVENDLALVSTGEIESTDEHLARVVRVRTLGFAPVIVSVTTIVLVISSTIDFVLRELVATLTRIKAIEHSSSRLLSRENWF